MNAISFNRKHGTFCTAGSDGTFNFWDKDAKQRLKGFPRMQVRGACPLSLPPFLCAAPHPEILDRCHEHLRRSCNPMACVLPQNSITSCDFNDVGDVFAYAVSYDWAKGSEQQNKTGACCAHASFQHSSFFFGRVL